MGGRLRLESVATLVWNTHLYTITGCTNLQITWKAFISNPDAPTREGFALTGFGAATVTLNVSAVLMRGGG
jgi:hypothetical protein